MPAKRFSAGPICAGSDDVSAGSDRVAGAGFYFLKNEAVLLELALQQFTVQHLLKRGYAPVSTPDWGCPVTVST